jgi:hypothetical protein
MPCSGPRLADAGYCALCPQPREVVEILGGAPERGNHHHRGAAAPRQDLDAHPAVLDDAPDDG